MNIKEAKLAILIKTCHGRPSLLSTLNSIKFTFQEYPYRIYLSDEEPLDEWKKSLYKKLEKDGHHIEINESGIKCGLARNKLLDNLNKENYILRLDDDFELGGEFNFYALKKVLNSSKKIGFCSDLERQIGKSKGVYSGMLRPAGGEINILPPNIEKKFHSPFVKTEKVNGIKYVLAEFTRNLLLVKREVFDVVRWNEELQFEGEHLEFMLSIKEAGFKGAYTWNSIHYHRDDLSIFRNNYKKNNVIDEDGEALMRKIFSKKWNCSDTSTNYPLSWYLFEGFRRLPSYLFKQ